ncbi:hypothetical protein HYFRA_00006822 [Hymenoscyphus fraxineus]|uniref:V-type c subunit family protein n=1 Tax=Hymenoscyphus fraxineus TaxID=746836 RepID=A0A9N9PFF6_9HELO|nr:hypothetical protein HYFRA_00006822 [Hymenoscyphus fraxineus]
MTTLLQVTPRLLAMRSSLSTRLLIRPNTSTQPWSFKQYPVLNSLRTNHNTALLRSSQATIVAYTPNAFVKNKMLAYLRGRFRTGTASYEARQTHPWAVVILATPQFAAWLEEPTFISDVLVSLTKAQTEGFPPLELDVVCACVDKVAYTVNFLRSASAANSRDRSGISILQGRSDVLLPGLWDDQVNPQTHTTELLSTITVASSQDDSIKIDMPLANTLFTNGRKSTLLISRWQHKDPESIRRSFVQIKSAEKLNQVVNALDDMAIDRPHMLVRVTPLTPARPITSGLGNIVRQIDFGNNDIGPASRELEAVVNKRMKTLPKERKNLEVWALIVPEAIVSQASPEMRKHLSSVDVGKLLDLDGGAVVYWVNRGAKFCRVVSGGGGWGDKEGLLSLDPQTTYSPIENSELEFPNQTIEEQKTSALGNIAEPGSLIQFFTRRKASEHERTSILQSSVQHQHTFEKSVVFGAVTDTVDTTEEKVPEKKVPEIDTKVIFYAGMFGFQSSSGMFLRQRPQPDGSEFTTKIGMPGSYVYSCDKLASINYNLRVIHRGTGYSGVRHIPILRATDQE